MPAAKTGCCLSNVVSFMVTVTLSFVCKVNTMSHFNNESPHRPYHLIYAWLWGQNKNFRAYWDFSPCFHFEHFNESEQKDPFVNSDTSIQGAESRKSYHFSSLILSVASHHGHWMWIPDSLPSQMVFRHASAYSTRAVDLSAWLQG